MCTRACATALLLTSLLPLAGRAQIIADSEARAARYYSQATMDAVARRNWFFAHASVGGNMMSGLQSLHAANPGFFKLIASDSSSADTPPATTQPGFVYGCARGNPGWQPKVDQFVTYVSNGWRSPKVALVANKFCYIDQDAVLSYYLNSMQNLEAANPGTRFVYMTMPLTVNSDADNYKRFLFNDGLRTWVAANRRLLFDVADIEAHAPDGTPQTFVWNGKTCQRLYASYSSDGGHLNDTGAQAVALGFYAVTASLPDETSGSDVPLLSPSAAIALALAFVGAAARYLRRRTTI